MPKSKKKPNWGVPGAFAFCRNQVEGDICAAALLYRLKYRWKFMKRKLLRHSLEWVAMSRSNWAQEAGLSEGEMKNRALPRLRKFDFVKIRQMKLTPDGPKLLWMHLDVVALNDAIMPWDDMYEPELNGMNVIGNEGWNSASPYKKSPDELFDEQH